MAVVGINSAASGPNDATLTVEPPAGAGSWLAVIWCAGSPYLPAPPGWSPVGMWGTGVEALMVYQSNTNPTSTWTRSWTDGLPFLAIIIGYDHAGATYGVADNPGSSISPAGDAPVGSDVVRIWRGSVSGTATPTPPAGTDNFESVSFYYPDDDVTPGLAVAHSIHQTPGPVPTAEWGGPIVGGAAASTAMIRPVVQSLDTPTGLAALGGDNEVGVNFSPVNEADSYLVQWRRTDLTPPAPTVQQGAPWHLSRASTEDLPFPPDYTYTWDGSGCTVYAMDNGIRATHEEYNDVTIEGSSVASDWWVDTRDHGTGTSAMAVGKEAGVAKGANLFMAQVYTGMTSAGVTLQDWMDAQAAIIAHANGKNASLFVTFAPPEGSWEDMVTPFYDAGISITFSGGNQGVEGVDPNLPQTPAPLLVGTSTDNDQKSSYSAWGSSIDVYAPLSPTTVASSSGDSAYRVGDGTSEASPMVAALEAKILQGNPKLSIARRQEVVLSQAFRDKLDLPQAQSGNHNRILNINASTEFWSDHPTSSTSLTLDGLDDGATYEVRVAAVAGETVSDWSAPVAATTTAPEVEPSVAYLGTQSITAMYLGSQPLSIA